ncbi:hypothetical protein [Candidatus Palauibacter sp.]|uniref:hypothetical protein n=1 Tax=Candidatus Palauibacter sp. TaxID=3101350 RepID=UPI003B52B6BB
MIENLVDVWLTEASERSYEAAFGQLLVIEGHRVIQGPMHHAHEHGKDIIAWDSAGDLCAYQLKGGSGRLDVPRIEALKEQLSTAAEAIIRHPSLPDSRLPDRVFLVTNQAATGPAQDRISVLSDGNRHRGLAPLHLIERAELTSRFVAAQRSFFPGSPGALNAFLALFLADGRGELPRQEFFRLLQDILPVIGRKPKAAAAARAISAAALTTALALRKWADDGNHAEVVVGWICFATQILRVAEKYSLGRARWHAAYRLALEEARRNARQLLEEALAAEDLVVPDPAEPLVHSARAVKVCGLVSAFSISQRIEFGVCHEYRGSAGQLVLREFDCLRIVGEVQAPDYFLSILAVNETGRYPVARTMLLSWVRSVARANKPGSTAPLPDPYHSVEDIILDSLPPEGTILADETFSGTAYTVEIGVRWATRRLWRQSLNAMWGDVSRLSHHRFNPAQPSDYFVPRSDRGRWASRFYPTPTRWSDLRAEAEEHEVAALPGTLRRCPEFVPFYCLALPHRFNAVVADFLDELASHGRVS